MVKSQQINCAGISNLLEALRIKIPKKFSFSFHQVITSHIICPIGIYDYEKTSTAPILPIYPISKSTFIYETKRITLSQKIGLKLILDLNSKFPKVHRGRCAHLFFDSVIDYLMKKYVENNIYLNS